MFAVTQEIPFCYGHRLLGHPGKCARLHGHNGLARLILKAEQLDAQGMVIDFDVLAARIGEWVSQTLDHRMLLHRGDPAAVALAQIGEPLLTLSFHPTAENLAKMIFEQAKAENLPIYAVELVEQPGSIARYSES
jgi:6-pyruvoyltetrahydropterin/6-carboxytetrahydropterin synthase